MPTSIISQPSTNKMMAAYRPITTQIQTDPVPANIPFIFIISGGGNTAVINPKPAGGLVAGDVLTINWGTTSGTYTLLTAVDNVTFYTVTTGTPFPTTPSTHTNVTMAIDGVQQTTPNGGPVPISFCDIYINSVFYKTLSKTQPVSINPGVSAVFEFDIQDALKEYLTKEIGPIKGSEIVDASGMIAAVYCKFRTSALDASGFLYSSHLAPIQATGTTAAVAGEGLQGNTFFVVNATLQHTDNQTLQTHLTEHKTGTWSASVFPMSHRPDNVNINPAGSDYFPILVTSDSIEPACLRLNYRMKNASAWLTADACPDGGVFGCASPIMAAFALPDALQDTPYSYSAPITGTAPFTLSAITKPSWMTVAIVGSTVEFTGTPAVGDVATGATVNFTVDNACGSSAQTETINVLSTSGCVPVNMDDVIPIFPDGETDVPYFYQFTVYGTQPFALTGITKPSWMTIAVSGDVVTLSGTPDVADTDIPVEFTVTNCAASEYDFAQTIDIIPITATNFKITNETTLSRRVANVTPVFYIHVSGPLPTAASETYEGDQNGYSGVIRVLVDGLETEFNYLRLYKNGTLVSQVTVTGDGGMYAFSTVTFTAADIIWIRFQTT